MSKLLEVAVMLVGALCIVTCAFLLIGPKRVISFFGRVLKGIRGRAYTFGREVKREVDRMQRERAN